MIQSIKYRSDIDGLRAVAILGVILFHAFPEYIPGGFTGVDVFFVISGYLITTIICKEIDGYHFSYKNFYYNRIRRLLPALLSVLIVVFIFGWYVLLDDEYKHLGKHIFGSATFTSNFVSLMESGYFDKSSDVKPLLHLWSLAIEEQFYIFWPFILALTIKRNYRVLPLIFLITVAISIVSSYIYQPFAFYTPLSRFWELSAGGLVALIALNKIPNDKIFNRISSKANLAEFISFCGIFLVLIGYAFVDSVGFPGFAAWIPVIGTVLILINKNNTITKRLLSTRLLVSIGLISYPLYLWHWPVLAYTRIINSQPLDYLQKIIIIFVSFLLAYLTYRYVERYLRYRDKSDYKALLMLFALIFCGIVGLVTYKNDGFPNRLVNLTNVSIHTGNDIGEGPWREDFCPVEDLNIKSQLAACNRDIRGNNKFALIGDSKAASLFTGLARTSSDSGRWVFVGGNGPGKHAVEPYISKSEIYKEYQQVSESTALSIAKDQNIEKVAIVSSIRVMFKIPGSYGYNQEVMTMNYQDALNGLDAFVNILAKSNKKIIFVLDNPELPNPEDCLMRTTQISLINSLFLKENDNCTLPIATLKDQTTIYISLLKQIKDKYPNNFDVFDTYPYLCDEGTGLCTHTKNGRFLYSYTDHISDYASGVVGAALNKFLNDH